METETTKDVFIGRQSNDEYPFLVGWDNDSSGGVGCSSLEVALNEIANLAIAASQSPILRFGKVIVRDSFETD